MKKMLLAAACTLGVAFASGAEDNPLWLRNVAISPDGTQVAFTYKGDIYTVPTSGGVARQITTSKAYDTKPVWSPDGKQIAFASDREGSLDIYVVNSIGGVPRRITTNSGSEKPMAWKDASHILYSTVDMPSVSDSQGGGFGRPQVYEVSVEGGRPRLFSTIPMVDVNINAKGEYVYNDRKGYEDVWRKHERSSVCTDIWTMSDASGKPKFTQQTTFIGNDRNPVWAPNGTDFYYLTEEFNGTSNVAKRSNGASKALTSFDNHPVRFLSVAGNGAMAFSWNGEIYTMTSENAQPQKLNVTIVSDDYSRDLIKTLRTSGATDFALSPKGDEMAFVLRGDVYVTSVKYKTTKQITNTPEQERRVSFSPDGRALVYDSERNGLWQVYESKIKNSSEKQFTYCTDVVETQLVKSDKPSFQPQYSPDGKEVAFLENRTTLRVINLASKAVRTVLDGKFNYSYTDGDQEYQWSPDSKWFLINYIGVGGWNNQDIALVKADGSQVVDLTESGYSDGNAHWVLGGKAMIWQSDREGYRSHGSWGSTRDEYIMFFDGEAYDKFRMSEEELGLYEEEKKAQDASKNGDADKKDKKKDKKGKDKSDKKAEAVKDLKFDLENRKYRVVRLTVNSSSLGDAYLTPKGDKLYYLASFEGTPDLWVHDLKKKETRLFAKGLGYSSFVADSAGTKLFALGANGMKQIDLSTAEQKAVEFEARSDYRAAAEREYIFDHMWQQVKDKFYMTDLHGVNWDLYRDAYRRFLPYINNNYDFAEMLSEILGELNASHTGGRYYAYGASMPTSYLGAFYDESYEGDGLKIAEVIKRGPIDKIGAGVKAGDIIMAIDGDTIKAGADYFPLLEGKAGKNTRLTVVSGGKSKSITVKPIGSNSDILYRRWVERNAAMVDSVSGGKVGYVHIAGMNSESFRTIFDEVLGKYRNREAIVIDTRYNGGGWLHDDVATLFSGKEYVRYTPRGQYIGSDPYTKWCKPSIMLASESNYSDAHGTPYVYKTLGLGKLVGAPVPGTMTAVWWETQVDPTIIFGIPQVASLDRNGKPLENQQLNPDVLILNTPEEVAAGIDRQLVEATKIVMKQAEEAAKK